MAFGFDLSPLVARAEEFEAWAEDVRAEERALRLVRERITLCRRDIAKMIATGIEEGVPTRRAGQGPSDWAEIHGLYRGLLERIPRTAAREELEPIAADLTLLADEILTLLESHVKTSISSANESQTERHIHNSNPNPPIDLEPASQEGPGAKSEPQPEPTRPPVQAFPLGMVLERLPRHRRLRQGRDCELARFPWRRGGGALDAGDQPERLGGGAIGHGRTARRDRRRRDPAARRGDRQRRRLSAGN